MKTKFCKHFLFELNRKSFENFNIFLLTFFVPLIWIQFHSFFFFALFPLVYSNDEGKWCVDVHNLAGASSKWEKLLRKLSSKNNSAKWYCSIWVRALFVPKLWTWREKKQKYDLLNCLSWVLHLFFPFFCSVIWNVAGETFLDFKCLLCFHPMCCPTALPRFRLFNFSIFFSPRCCVNIFFCSSFVVSASCHRNALNCSANRYCMAMIVSGGKQRQCDKWPSNMNLNEIPKCSNQHNSFYGWHFVFFLFSLNLVRSLLKVFTFHRRFYVQLIRIAHFFLVSISRKSNNHYEWNITTAMWLCVVANTDIEFYWHDYFMFDAKWQRNIQCKILKPCVDQSKMCLYIYECKQICEAIVHVLSS